jgi:hypothetical protein
MKLTQAIAIAALALAAAGCTIGHVEDPKPGQYADYRSLAIDRAQKISIQGVPEPLMRQVRTCMIDTSLDYITPAELERWNAYARGQVAIPQSEYQAFDRELQKRMGDDVIPTMQKKCPSTMAELAKYKA